MLAAVALVLLGQHPCGPAGPIFCSGGQSLAFFEFAPLSGAGMTAPCACTAVTGAKGEALTFTRASSGTCLKGSTTTGIANGDMVTCSSNQPRVMPGGDGSGGSGLLVEGARTNSLLRSEEVENAAWTKSQDAAPRAPTVTANQAVAPDGTTTADRVLFKAASGSEFSSVFGVCGGVASAGSIFVKGVSGSGTIDIATFQAGVGANCPATPCSFNSTTWTRCSVTRGATTNNFIIGTLPVYGGNCVGSATDVDIYVWGGQCEAGAFASSYIATAGAAVARAADAASFAGIATAVGSGGSAAATVVTTGSGTRGMIYFANTSVPLWFAPNAIHTYDGTTDLTLATTFATQPHRYASSWSGSALSVFDVTEGTTATGSFDGAMTTTSFVLGAGQGGGASTADHLFGVIKRVCVDPNPARCR